VLALTSAKLPIIEMFIKIRNNELRTDLMKIMSASKIKGLGW
jgi:ribosomal protein S8